MNLKLLNDVLALIEEASFTKAAQRRNVTQPAFSRRIKAMEEWLGFKCVVRSGSSVTVTPEALATEERIRSLISQMHELKDYAASEAHRKKRLTFTAPHTLSIHLFPSLVRYLNETLNQDDYMYQLKSSYKEDCLAVFLRGDADIFICNEELGKSSVPLSFQCEHIILGQDRLIPVVAGAWKDKVGKDGLISDLVPMISYPKTSYLSRMLGREALPRFMENHVIETVFETAFSAGVKAMALEGFGVGWLPKSFVDRELDDQRLISLEDYYGSCALDLVIYMATHHGKGNDMYVPLEALRHIKFEELMSA